MRAYNSRGGSFKDVGAPGGGYGRVGGAPPDTTAQAEVLRALQGERAVAASQPLTERETYGTLAKVKPEYDVEAANLADPAAIEQKILTDIGAGKVDPGVGRELLSRYAGVAKQATEDHEFRPELLQEILQPSAMAGPPAPDRAAALLQAPSPLPQAQAAAAEATQQALEPAPDAPGSTRSPALAAAGGSDPDALLAEMRGPRRQSMTVPGVGGEVGYEMNAPFIPPGMGQGPAVPPWMADLPEDIRLVLEGATHAAGGHESAIERRRRLAREAARRG
jgi:hypothetical protein